MSTQQSTQVFSTVRKEPTARASRIGALWDAFDLASTKGEITSKHLPSLIEQTGLNGTTVRCQFYAWRAKRSQQRKPS